MKPVNKNVNVLLEGVKLPKMVRVQQIFDDYFIEDARGALHSELEKNKIKERVKPGMSIAITAGSRGIDNYITILKDTVDFLKECGAKPFIIPAMGSHGGATAEGQLEILESFGITEASMGCPIKATMEVETAAELDDGTSVYLDKYAGEADGIVVINRIKPHTGFRGRHESGLFKMMAVGLGKQKGAETVHGRGRSRMSETIEKCGDAHLAHSKILFGIATVENAFDKTCVLEVLLPEKMKQREEELLEKAKELLPRIVPQKLDVLLVDYMGKNISGVGMDTNITKSFAYGYGISREGRATRIAVMDLTDESHGAAAGLGAADITTYRLFSKINQDTTYPNMLTNSSTDAVKIPMVLDNQRMAVKAAIKTAIGADKENVRMVRIQDTLHLAHIWISEALLEEAKQDPNLKVLGEPEEMQFDENGDLF